MLLVQKYLHLEKHLLRTHRLLYYQLNYNIVLKIFTLSTFGIKSLL